MRLATTPGRPIADSAVVEVDGVLDAVGAYDLCRSIDEAVGAQVREVVLDLTHVVAVDVDGLAALERCARRLQADGVVLACTVCSMPVRRALRV